MNKRGNVVCIVGGAWGDEAKGNLVQRLEQDADLVMNTNGGPNAGSGVMHEGKKITLSQVSPAILTPGKEVLLGNHMVVDPVALCEEIAALERAGVSVQGRIQILAGASIIQPNQRLRDLATMKCIGTTGKGIGCAYADRATRMCNGHRVDIRAGDVLADPRQCTAMAMRNLRQEVELLDAYGLDAEDKLSLYETFGDFAGQIDRFAAALATIRKLVQLDPLYVQSRVRDGAHLLLKCSQGAALCLQNGTAPYQTSSYVNAPAAAMSANIPPEYVDRVWLAVKAITTRVGEGAFPTEIGGQASREHCMKNGGTRHTRDVEQALYGKNVSRMLHSANPLERSIAVRMLAKEYGERTGRPRRPGYPDGVLLRTMARINGVTDVFVSKIDCLHLLGDPVLLATRYEIPGYGSVDFMPATEALLEKAVPQYEEFDGCGAVKYGERNPRAIPRGTRQLLYRMQELAEAPVSMIGTGPEAEAYISFGDRGIVKPR